MKITVYEQKGCGVCRQLVPLLRKVTKQRKISLEVVDIDKCGERCADIRYIPKILVDGQEVSMPELGKILKNS